MYEVGVVTKSDKQAEFNCRNTSLNRYFRELPLKYAKRNMNATYVVIDQNDSDRVIGYYGLSQFFVNVDDIEKKLRKKLPKYHYLPETLLGALP